LISFNNTPAALSDFSSTPLQNFFSTSKEGPYCIPVGFASFPDAKNGTNATIQIQHDGGDGNLYQVRHNAPLLPFTCD
jgi:hypothetical protein